MLIKKPNQPHFKPVTTKELIKHIQLKNLNTYYGHTDKAIESWLFSSKDPLEITKLKYEDIYECKKTEKTLKQYCTTVRPRRYGNSSWTTLGVTMKCKEELDSIKGNMSYEQIIWDLILTYYENH